MGCSNSSLFIMWYEISRFNQITLVILEFSKIRRNQSFSWIIMMLMRAEVFLFFCCRQWYIKYFDELIEIEFKKFKPSEYQDKQFDWPWFAHAKFEKFEELIWIHKHQRWVIAIKKIQLPSTLTIISLLSNWHYQLN